MKALLAACAAFGEHVFAMRLFLFSLILLALAGCAREPAVISPPKDAAAVVEPFLKAVRAGNPPKDNLHVAAGAMDELIAKLPADHKRLAAAAPLTPRYMARGLTPQRDEVTLVYAAKKGDKWTTATVRVFRDIDEPYRVEYWRISNAEPTPPLPSGMKPEMVQMQHTMMYVVFGAMAFFGLLGLGVLLWMVKRKPHLVVNEIPEETRANAVSVRDDI